MDDTISNRNIWNHAFQETDRFHWHEPHIMIQQYLDASGSGDGRNMLDIGCGYGRHAVAFASLGYVVSATDISTHCLQRLQEIADANALPITTLEWDMLSFPYPFMDKSFDAVVAAQSIHHTTAEGLSRILTEIARLLVDGGVLLASLSHTPPSNEVATEIEPGTLVPLDGIEQGIPHRYICEDELRSVLKDFSLKCVTSDHRNFWFIAERV
ncbi:MAG: class I SAM-dependent methyltransferase [Armatimonadota bacterium]